MNQYHANHQSPSHGQPAQAHQMNAWGAGDGYDGSSPPGDPGGSRNGAMVILAIGAAALVLLFLAAGAIVLARSGESVVSAAGSTTELASDPAKSAPKPSVPADATDVPDADLVEEVPVVLDAPVPDAIPTPQAPAQPQAPARPQAPQTPQAPTPPAPPSTPAPVISSVSAPESIDCHNGNFQTFSLGWTANHATKVTVSIDGPGIYDTYGPNETVSLPFSCPGPHTFLITAYGQDGRTATRTITLLGRNMQTETPDTEDADEL